MTVQPHHSESWWLGRLASAINEALTHPEIAKTHLRSTLVQFKRSPACGEPLRNHLDERKQ